MDDVDVLIVGAGLSGIGLARELQHRMPGLHYEILEARGATGGTWDLFRYPGIRSDSDLYTFGYRSRPWLHDKAIAGGDVILRYLRDAAAEGGIESRIRLHHRVLSADWSSLARRWTVEVERTDTGERLVVTTRWLFSAAGYYRYDRGFTPVMPDLDGFAGQVVHPQFWPEGMHVTDRRVVVVGSGATAVTLVPALAAQGAQVTMLQRTPSYILYSPSSDRAALRLRRVFGDALGHALARAKNIARQRLLWLFARIFPDRARRFIRSTIVRQLGADYPVDVHFNPPYNPWDQRLCLVPDGDFFAAIRRGQAKVVTDRIAGFTADAVRLESGDTLPADVLVTATGLEVMPFGGILLRLDGAPVTMADHVAYKGVMLDGIPNFAFAIGYTNASWTLKVELIARYFTRLLSHMNRHGVEVCTPSIDGGLNTRPLLDFDAGYVKRVVSTLPQQGTRRPWRMSMNYYADVRNLRWAPLRDRRLRMTKSRPAGTGPVATSVGGDGTVVSTTDEHFVETTGGLRLCYRVDGPPDGRPIVLISGLGQDMYAWPASLVDRFAEAGMRVVRLDNRDVGRSSHVAAKPPTRLQQMRGQAPAGAYALSDMAGDVIAVMDAEGIRDAHLVGMSLGGMIAQSIAAGSPGRVRSLTSIFSTTGDRRVGQPARSTIVRMIGPAPETAEAHAARHARMLGHIASRTLPFDPEIERAWADSSWARGSGRRSRSGIPRQIGAINASGDRTAELRRVTAPTLVVHGDRDLMVHPSGGRATAAAVPGATHVVVPGMSHHLAPALLDRLAGLIVDHASGADARTREDAAS